MQRHQNETQTAAIPKDAAAVILLDESGTKVVWAQRNPKLKFLGGFHGFPGGKVDFDDSYVEVRNCADREHAKFIACTAREVFEEVGVLLVRNGEKLTKGQRESLHDDLISERFKFSEILQNWGLWLDAEDFLYTGFWTTPEFSPIRFKTHFYLARCPSKQTPYAAISELRRIEFIAPNAALDLWSSSKVLIAPPVLISLRELVENFDADESLSAQIVAGSLLEKSSLYDGNINYIELNSRITCFPLRTKTLPPATHTNCFIVGGKKFVVIDAASKATFEQDKLFELVEKLIENGSQCQSIIVSHLHGDHVGGETALQTALRDAFGLEIPISAHRITAESLVDKVHFDKLVEDDEIFELTDFNGDPFELRALHTPGHARGHLCFYDEEFGFLLTSDNVLSYGSVLIAMPEGNMNDYLNSLKRMKNLPNLNFLCGSHGSANSNAKLKIGEYIEHRLLREKQILDAINTGAEKPEEIAEIVYQGIEPNLFPLAVESVRAHIVKLEEDRSA